MLRREIYYGGVNQPPSCHFTAIWLVRPNVVRPRVEQHSTLRRSDCGSPRTECCEITHLHYNTSYCRRARAAKWRSAFTQVGIHRARFKKAHPFRRGVVPPWVFSECVSTSPADADMTTRGTIPARVHLKKVTKPKNNYCSLHLSKDNGRETRSSNISK